MFTARNHPPRRRWTMLLFRAWIASITATTAHGASATHHPYAEARRENLAEIGTYRDTGRRVLMRIEAAETYRAMAEAAAAEGVELVPISGFRSIAYQEGLFTRKMKQVGSEEEAVIWVAPPGYSEHHTGWVIDIGDRARPETDVEVTFETTPAFRWLERHAARFGFELSFPRGNDQGVGYEPWHWRYVRSPAARRELFRHLLEPPKTAHGLPADSGTTTMPAE